MRRRNERNKTKTDMGAFAWLEVSWKEKAVDASCVLERAGERERERERASLAKYYAYPSMILGN